ncbi:hypothetical protein [Bdellovibrio svalbardensis]|uniref:Uncharacterized protein n=1 Tax=Bdellovibrio svalbardensis TaxID=2972972 RepID=A0ABT6DI10_9BACT|nr:hypothetical protein [Bdellovibrio svalbardensis]MDG0816491.1 hypothetical protein [Bdellovibrio svalbardensis]
MSFRFQIFTFGALTLIGLGSIAIGVFRTRKSAQGAKVYLTIGVFALLGGAYFFVNPPGIHEGPGPMERCISEFSKAVANSKLFAGDLKEKTACLNDSVSEFKNEDLLVDNIIDVAVANQSKVDEDFQYLVGTVFISSTESFAKKLKVQKPADQKYLCNIVTNTIPDHPIPGDDPRVLILESLCKLSDE